MLILIIKLVLFTKITLCIVDSRIVKKRESSVKNDKYCIDILKKHLF